MYYSFLSTSFNNYYYFLFTQQILFIDKIMNIHVILFVYLWLFEWFFNVIVLVHISWICNQLYTKNFDAIRPIKCHFIQSCYHIITNLHSKLCSSTTFAQYMLFDPCLSSLWGEGNFGGCKCEFFFQNVRLLCCSHNSLHATIVVIDGAHVLRLQICVAVPVIAEF